MANTSENHQELVKCLQDWYEKPTDYHWNRILIALYPMVEKWTAKLADHSGQSAFGDNEDLASTAYMKLIEEFTASSTSEEKEDEDYSTLGSSKNHNKNATIITKAFLLENIKEYSAIKTVSYLKNRVLQYCKAYNDSIILNKHLKNQRNKIYKIIKEDLLVSANKQYKEIAERLLKNQNNNGNAIDLGYLISKKSNICVADSIKHSFDDYYKSLGNASPREKSNANKELLKHIIISLAQLEELKEISVYQLSDAIFNLWDSRNSVITSIETVADSDEDKDIDPFEFICLEDNQHKSAEESFLTNFQDSSSIILNKAKEILEKYLPTTDSIKPKAKQIKAFLIHYAILSPEFMDKTIFPKEISKKITELLLQRKRSKDTNDDHKIKTKIIGKILNQEPHTSLYQIEQFRNELWSSYSLLCQKSESFADSHDFGMLCKCLVILAVNKLGNKVENYTSCILSEIGGSIDE